MAWEDEFKVGPEPTYSPTMVVICVVIAVGVILFKTFQYFFGAA